MASGERIGASRAGAAAPRRVGDSIREKFRAEVAALIAPSPAFAAAGTSALPSTPPSGKGDDKQEQPPASAAARPAVVDVEGGASEAFASPAAYATAMEEALFNKFGASPSAYRAQLLALLANLRHLLPELGALEPGELAVLPPEAMISTTQRRQREREQRRRARLLRYWDDTNLMCASCQRPRLSRLNTNRCDIDDESLGNQFENIYADGVWCECAADRGEGEAGNEANENSSDTSGEEEEEEKGAKNDDEKQRKQINSGSEKRSRSGDGAGSAGPAAPSANELASKATRSANGKVLKC